MGVLIVDDTLLAGSIPGLADVQGSIRTLAGDNGSVEPQDLARALQQQGFGRSNVSFLLSYYLECGDLVQDSEGRLHLPLRTGE